MNSLLQQHLPFTVLKLAACFSFSAVLFVATALTVYGIETEFIRLRGYVNTLGCNSTYRLRY